MHALLSYSNWHSNFNCKIKVLCSSHSKVFYGVTDITKEF